MNAQSAPSVWAVTDWLPRYRAEWLRPDVVAGLTLAAYLVPAGIGDASLADLPPQAGLYACLFGGLVFWIFCSSRQTVITVTSALSLLVGASVAELSAGDPARHAALAACLALMIAALAIAAYLFARGSAVAFFSETVLVGFKAGLALYLASTQLPKLLGFAGSHGDFWERLHHLVTNLGQRNPAARDRRPYGARGARGRKDLAAQPSRRLPGRRRRDRRGRRVRRAVDGRRAPRRRTARASRAGPPGGEPC